MDEYNLARAFKRIEEELIRSMIRNLERHKAEETEEGFNWDQWQVVQLRELEKYRKTNWEKFGEEFEVLNGQLEELLRITNEDAQTEAEKRILEEIERGNFDAPEEDPGLAGELIGINENKLNALIEATTEDLEKAEHSVLRRSNDIYRQVINDAQVYATSGGTYEQAIDMATKDFARRGITSIVYKNGSRHSIRDYSEMAIRTATKRAYLMGEGKKQAEYGIHTVRVNKRTDACPLCLRWTGKVLIDDVYGGGTKQEAREKRLPLLSTAMAKGFLHPNCKDVYSIYFPGISKPAEPWTEYELKVLADKYNQEEGIKHAEIMAGRWQMVADTRLDAGNKEAAKARVEAWKAKAKALADRSAGSVPEKELHIPIGEYDSLVDLAKQYGIDAKSLQRLSRPLTTQEIIDKLAGKDPTNGSCVSIACAYLGNKMGYDVKDFRGGRSQALFANRQWRLNAISNWFGIKGKAIRTKDELATVKKMIAQMTPGREYLLSAGAHAAIIRKSTQTGEAWYIEFQLKKTGWLPLTDNALIKRFNCTGPGTELAYPCIIDAESLQKSAEFLDLLEYINTV